MNGIHPNPSRKALLVMTLFLVAGFASIMHHDIDWGISMPLILFYVTLCINTYYSVKLFTSLVPETDIQQGAIDIVLVFLYFWLAWYIGNGQILLFITSLMFAGATIKYTLLLNKLPHKNLLRRKIVIDSIGTFGTIVAYGGTIFIHPSLFIWIWSLSFVLVNVYILTIKPLYTTYFDQ
jgi:hypothetical protein